MLELAILGLLKEQDLHGYELKKRLTESLGVFTRLSYGSLYPALARLEKAGAITAQGVAAISDDDVDVVPATGSLGAELAAFRHRRTSTRDVRDTRGTRGRKVYGITPTGEALFAELLAADGQAGDDDRAFALKLAFARHLPGEQRLGLLERRRAQLVERLARIRSSVRTGRDRLDDYSRSVVEHSTETTEADISWLDRLIAAERGQHQ